MDKIKVKVLILPKFEVGGMDGDTPGEAQYFYDAYVKDAEQFSVPGTGGETLYYRDGVALCMLGMGKVSAALGTMAILCDSRFDFSQAYIISTGCAGSAAETTVMGDVFVVSAAVDYDLGHHADVREMAVPKETTWFHDRQFDRDAVVLLNPELTEKVFRLVKDVPLETTERTRNYMKAAFNGAAWALRDPKVMKGTTATSDNYWKGRYAHKTAMQMVETYGCPDPFALTEMEDVAVARAVERMGLLDRLIIIRDSVNMDVFVMDATPESLWGEDAEALKLARGPNAESADIFPTSMKNNFAVTSVVIDRILSGSF